jgi:hypothetical protein
MTEAAARRKALQLARKLRTTYYVVWERDTDAPAALSYHVATDYDLDTFFAGISDHNILFCTADAL